MIDQLPDQIDGDFSSGRNIFGGFLFFVLHLDGGRDNGKSDQSGWENVVLAGWFDRQTEDGRAGRVHQGKRMTLTGLPRLF